MARYDCYLCKDTGIIEFPPEMAGYYMTSHTDNFDNVFWKTPEGKMYLFPPNESPKVLAPCGSCYLVFHVPLGYTPKECTTEK